MKRNGFTLIELLVVVSIILILATISTVVVQRAKLKAKQAPCASNIRQIGMAILLYSQDNNDLLPKASDKASYYNLLSKYIPDMEITICPANPGQGERRYSVYNNTNNVTSDDPNIIKAEIVADNCGVAWGNAGSDHKGTGGNVYYMSGKVKWLETAPANANAIGNRLD